VKQQAGAENKKKTATAKQKTKPNKNKSEPHLHNYAKASDTCSRRPVRPT